MVTNVLYASVGSSPGRSSRVYGGGTAVVVKHVGGRKQERGGSAKRSGVEKEPT